MHSVVLLAFFDINLPGVGILAVAFGVAFGLGRLTGFSSEGPLMLIAGPLCMALDLLYRLKRGISNWFSNHAGGAFFYIPIWMLGILWFVLGIFYTIEGRK